MYCRHCGTKNNTSSKFCTSCGKPMKKQRASSWLWSIVVLLILSIGAVYYVVYDSLNEKDRAVSLSNNMTEAVEAVIPAKTLTTSEVDTTDRVALIKHIQESVFTVLTSYGQGSGFLYASGGYVVTNAHVVQGEVDVAVRSVNGSEHAATVIGISEDYDIALLHVPHYAEAKPLPIEKEESPVGLEVIAFGTPQGFENSASTGYITGHNRDFAFEDFIYKQVYQVDAQIDKGSSGGALVDATTGRVIGINSLLYTSETSTNFGFSIPLYSMMSYFDSWIAEPMSSEAVLQAGGVYEVYVQQEESYTPPAEETDDVLVGQYVQSFRMYYEKALNDSDFTWVADMLTGAAYDEMYDYVNDISYNGHVFEFLTNDVLDVTYDDGVYYVNTNETFYFYPSSGPEEYFDRYKTYTVIADEYVGFQIAAIDIHQ